MDERLQKQELLSNDDKYQEQNELDNKILTIIDVMDEIKKDNYKKENYRRYILRLYEYWNNKAPEAEVNDGCPHVWGSKLNYHAETVLNDIFTDNLLSNVMEYFITNQVSIISDINGKVLMSLLFYPNVGYIKYKATMDILFGEKNCDEIIESDSDEKEFEWNNANKTKEVDELLQDGNLEENPKNPDHDDLKLNISELNLFGDKADGEIIKSDSYEQEISPSTSDSSPIKSTVENLQITDNVQFESSKWEDVNKTFEETLWFASSLREEITKHQQSISDLQSYFLTIHHKTAEQNQIIMDMEMKEIESKKTIQKQQQAIIEMLEIHKDQLKNKDQKIDSMERDLAQKAQDLVDKNLIIASQEVESEKKNLELDVVNRELITKDKLLAEKEAELEKKEQELDLSNRELTAKDMLIVVKEADLIKNIQELDAVKQELKTNGMQLTEIEADLEKKSQELDLANQKLMVKDVLLAEREEKLHGVTQELESLREEKMAAKRSFLEFTKVKESMQNVMKLLRGDNNSELKEALDTSPQQSSANKDKREIS